MFIRIIAVILLALSPPALAQINDFGIGGILDIPSARMPSEGTFTATYSQKDVVDAYAVSFQPLSRLETAFRYTISFDRNPNPVPGSFCDLNFAYCENQLKDRSFEAKFMLLRESSYLPQVAVGVRDLLGTGVWGSEYLVASKKISNLDFTVGLGWGRLAERDIAKNPLIQVSERFSRRSADVGVGGVFSIDNYFSGANVGLFGGAIYRIPQWDVRLMAAYNSDSYARERRLGIIRDADPLSFGLEWEATPGVRLGVSWQQGNQLALRISGVFNSAASAPRRPPNRFGAADSPAAPAVDPAEGSGWWPQVVNDAEASGLLFRNAQRTDDGGLTIRYSNAAYQLEADAIARSIAVSDLYIPLEFTTLTFTGDALGLPTHSVVYRRPQLQMSAALAPADIEISAPVDVKQPNYVTIFNYPNGLLKVSLNLKTYLFDPDFPLLNQLDFKVRGDIDLDSGWAVSGAWEQNIKSQFDRIRRGGESQLPKVRTLAPDYLKEGKSGIQDLVLLKRGKLGRDVYYQLFGGYLEDMFAGVGGAVLWRPFDSRFAVGGNIIAVRQREVDRLFLLRDYQTVTGHFSAYWASPFHGFDVAIHAGRYLAGDVGATLEVQKRFANGWSVGAFATLTDVPFEVFGEGSFDKGLIFRIPLDLYSSRNVRTGFRTILRPINRDGGRMVENWPTSLWEELRDRHPDRLRDNLDRMRGL